MAVSTEIVLGIATLTTSAGNSGGGGGDRGGNCGGDDGGLSIAMKLMAVGSAAEFVSSFSSSWPIGVVVDAKDD